MIRSLWPLVAVALFFSACSSTPEEPAVDPEKTKLKIDNQALQAAADEREAQIAEYIEAVNEIENNIQEIKKRENLIEVGYQDVELQKPREEQIAEDIVTIGRLLEENKQKVAALRQALQSGNVRIQALEEMITRLNQAIEAKDGEIAELKTRLTETNMRLDQLMADYAASQATVEAKTDELNTAWFAFGSAKELKDNGVVSKEGGFIGVGGAQKLREDFNKEYFTQLDIRNADTLDLFGKKAKMITTHAKGSYSILGQGVNCQLVISDPKKFWGASKYLVVQVD